MKHTKLVVAVACLLAWPSGALAQQDGPGARGGQWLSLGVGTGVDRVACDICSGNLETGLSGFVRFGGTLSSRLSAGVQASGWTRSEEEIRQTQWGLKGLLVFRPDPASGLHLTAGLGLLGYRASEDGSALTSTTFGFAAGAGYDFGVRPDVSLAPFVQVMIAPRTELQFNGEPAVGNARFGLLQAGLALTWH